MKSIYVLASILALLLVGQYALFVSTGSRKVSFKINSARPQLPAGSSKSGNNKGTQRKEVTVDKVIAEHTSQAQQSGALSVYGKRTVRVDGTSVVFASDGVTVYARGTAIVYALSKVTVYAYGNVTVYAYDKSIIHAHDRVIVLLLGDATVNRYGQATVKEIGTSMNKHTRKVSPVVSMPPDSTTTTKTASRSPSVTARSNKRRTASASRHHRRLGLRKHHRSRTRHGRYRFSHKHGRTRLTLWQNGCKCCANCHCRCPWK